MDRGNQILAGMQGLSEARGGVDDDDDDDDDGVDEFLRIHLGRE